MDEDFAEPSTTCSPSVLTSDTLIASSSSALGLFATLKLAILIVDLNRFIPRHGHRKQTVNHVSSRARIEKNKVV